MNRPDKCALSGKTCWKVKLQVASDQPLAGEPRLMEGPLPCAFRVTLLFIDGTHGAVTIHEDHVDELKDRLPELWRNCLERMVWEYDHAKELGATPFNSEQTEAAKRERLRRVHCIPIGVLAVKRWIDTVDEHG